MRPLRRLVAAAAAAAGLAACAGPPHLERAPDLLLVTLDTVRADHLGAYGDTAAETPNLDGLARGGARFASVTSAAPLTLPSHATLLSGLLPPHHGLRNNGLGRFPEARATLATVLHDAGYRTGAFVGAFVLDHRFGLGRGFEVYDDEIVRGTGDEASALGSERSGREVVDRALAWLDGGDGRPFFAWVHLYDAHAPYEPPEPFRSRHENPYDGEVAFVDAQVGRLLDDLEHRGLAGRTVVAVVADHGEALGEHGELTHGLLLYQPTLAVPWIVRGPGIAPGTLLSTPVSLVDVAPTLAGLAGHPLPAADLDGRDLSVALRTGREPPPADLYAETEYPRVFGWSGLAALRHRRFKYIAGARSELYDLGADPGEEANLVASRRRDAAGFAERLAEIGRSARPTETGSGVDRETRARLESLGYAAATHPRAASAAAEGEGADPKDMAPLFRAFEEAHWALDAGRLDEAEARLEKLVAADPSNPVFRSTLARTLRRRGDLERAIELYRQAAGSAPDDPDAWYNLAVTLQEAGHGDAAADALARALALEPGRPEAHNALGIALAARGRTEEAAQEFARTVELDPRNARAWNNLGNVRRDQGRLEEAARAYRKAVELAPAYADPLNGLGTLTVQEDRPREAVPFFDRALALDPSLHEVRLNRAIALELSGDRAAAIAGYRDFLAVSRHDPQFTAQRRAAEQLLARLAQGG